MCVCVCVSAVVPVIIDEVDAARRAAALKAPSSDPRAKILALKKEFQQSTAAG